MIASVGALDDYWGRGTTSQRENDRGLFEHRYRTARSEQAARAEVLVGDVNIADSVAKPRIIELFSQPRANLSL